MVNMRMVAMAGFLAAAGCNKNDFLNEKPQQSLVVPTTLQDFQAILDNDNVMNGALNMGVVPALGETGAADYYLVDSNYQGHLSLQEQNEYTWAVNPYPGADVSDWDLPYIAVLYANEVITGITGMQVTASDQPEWNNLMGSALFYRSFFFYNLTQLFAPPYRQGETQLGIPLRLTADINEELVRASLAETYTQIITDLKTATGLLPITALYGTRPCRPAAYGLLARVYLVIGDYTDARAYADTCLSLYNTLIDYNTLDTTLNQPIVRFNGENLFNCVLIRTAPFLYGRVDSNLYAAYQPNDLRPGAWFKGNPARLKCSYDGSFNPYGGIATDEVYLIRAECSARAGDLEGAMGDLNTLLIKRFATGTFQPLSATSSTGALTLILAERRKELVFRGLRWPDLRRLGSDPGFADTLYRFVLGKLYTLPPNDLRYTYPIPDNVLGFNPGMVQNPR
jgi:hypothetical protein